jgi:hypothetical protein
MQAALYIVSLRRKITASGHTLVVKTGHKPVYSGGRSGKSFANGWPYTGSIHLPIVLT